MCEKLGKGPEGAAAIVPAKPARADYLGGA